MIVFTRKWFIAKTLAAYRPNIPVYAFSFEDKLIRKLNILFWITAFKIEKKSNEETVEDAIKILQKKWLIKSLDKIISLYDIEKDWKIIPSLQIRVV
jgi:pyruvate kinase